jgi:hypothetical protein
MLDVGKVVIPQNGYDLQKGSCNTPVVHRLLVFINSKNIDIEHHMNIDYCFPFFKLKKIIEYLIKLQ